MCVCIRTLNFFPCWYRNFTPCWHMEFFPAILMIIFIYYVYYISGSRFRGSMWFYSSKKIYVAYAHQCGTCTSFHPGTLVGTQIGLWIFFQSGTVLWKTTNVSINIMANNRVENDFVQYLEFLSMLAPKFHARLASIFSSWNLIFQFTYNIFCCLKSCYQLIVSDIPIRHLNVLPHSLLWGHPNRFPNLFPATLPHLKKAKRTSC